MNNNNNDTIFEFRLPLFWMCSVRRATGKAGMESFIKLISSAYFMVFKNLNRPFFDLILICGSAGFNVMLSYKLYRIAEQSNKNE